MAQQLSDLLQCFPAAAIGGVQWKTLLQKYEDFEGCRSFGSFVFFFSPFRNLTRCPDPDFMKVLGETLKDGSHPEMYKYSLLRFDHPSFSFLDTAGIIKCHPYWRAIKQAAKAWSF